MRCGKKTTQKAAVDPNRDWKRLWRETTKIFRRVQDKIFISAKILQPIGRLLKSDRLIAKNSKKPANRK
jgi:hypothetical protein